MSKNRRKYSPEFKRKVVDDFVSGRKTAPQLAAEHGVDSAQVYQWKSQLKAQDRSDHLDELVDSGMSPADAKLFQQKEDELAEYKRIVAQLTLENDLLKKLDQWRNSRRESALTGLIDTIKKSARRKERAK